MMMSMDPSGMHLKASSITLAGLGDALSRFTERPIVDMTGIQGQYDFDLAFSPETMRGMQLAGGSKPPPGGDHPAGADAAPEQGASIFDAVQAYGLKLEPRKAPLEMLTIDHIEKTPTEN
ncbi:MAG: TIGR03435 family protein, partial [Terriglobales bacterium]